MDSQWKLVSSIQVYLCAETREQITAFLSGLEGALHEVSHVGALSVYVKLILISIGQSSPFISSQVHSIRCQVVACYIVVCQSGRPSSMPLNTWIVVALMASDDFLCLHLHKR